MVGQALGLGDGDRRGPGLGEALAVDALAHAIELLTKYRRYQQASDLIGRALALDSTRLDLWSLRVELMDKAGDRASLARAVRDYRARGGQLTASRTYWLRHGDTGLRRELADATLDTYGTNTRNDTLFLLDQDRKSVV